MTSHVAELWSKHSPPLPLWDASQLFTTRGHPQSIYIDTQGSIITHIYYISFVITIAKQQYSFSEVKLKRRISFEIQKLSCITNPFPPCNSRKCFPDQEDLPLYIWIFWKHIPDLGQWATLFPLRCKLKCVWQLLLRSIPSLTDPHPASDWSHKVWWHLQRKESWLTLFMRIKDDIFDQRIICPAIIRAGVLKTTKYIRSIVSSRCMKMYKCFLDPW